MEGKAPEMTGEEISVLMDEFISKKDILDSDDKSLDSSRKKQAAWEAITTKVNACSVHQRSVTQIQVKIKNIKSKAKSLFAQNRKAQRGTGGGPPAKKCSAAEQKMMDLYADTAAWRGVPGGKEASEIPKIKSAEPSTSAGVDGATPKHSEENSANKTVASPWRGRNPAKRSTFASTDMKLSKVRRLQIEALQTEIQANQEIISTCQMIKDVIPAVLTALKSQRGDEISAE